VLFARSGFLTFFQEGYMDIVTNIYEGFCRKDAAEQHRGYLGMSSIGKPCEREAWHSWRQTTPALIEGRVLGLFQVGHHIEQIICGGLRAAGHVLKSAWPDEQMSFSDFGGFFSGHPDGLIWHEGEWCILECKSANMGKFKALKEKGVAEVYQVYVAQMQLYMGYAGVRKAVLIVMNKNDSTLHAEEIAFDEASFSRLRVKAAKVLTAKASWNVEGPPEEEPHKDCDACKWCSYRGQCYDGAEHIQTIKTCRSCAWFQMSPAFEPSCSNPKHAFPLKALEKSCGDWEYVDQWSPLEVPF
jgi:hypothetical protein